ncbi:MAG: hypothetical protein JXB34_02515 [Bacteroidales bacterium]|nr:hypothetical protein [Bacteroidales bacterium]
MKKFAIFFTLLVLSCTGIYSQDERYFYSEETDVKNNKAAGKWVFGGDIGLAFGKITYIEISPVASYRFTDRFMAGPGFIYMYENYKDYGFESSLYGLRTVAMYSLFSNLKESINLNIGDIVLYAENQVINKDRYYFNGLFFENDGRGWVDNLLAGGGIYQRFGERGGGLAIMVLFEITQNKYSTYNNPILKFGFFF